GLAAEKMPFESLGVGGWTRSAALVALAIVIPAAASAALVRGIPAPAFARVLARSDERARERLALILGLCVIALTLVAIQAALGLTFDPRYKDFPYPALTAAVVPVAVLMFGTPRGAGRRGAAEIASAGTLVLSAGYIVLNEGFSNWQSLWFCAAIVLLAFSLLRVRDARD